MFCKYCGKELNDNALICPNCGVATDKYMAVAKTADAQQKTNGLAIAGMICAIVGLIGGDYFFCIPSIIGLILSIVGMVKVKQYNSGYGFALTGIIIGAISLLIWLMVWIFIGWIWLLILFA